MGRITKTASLSGKYVMRSSSQGSALKPKMGLFDSVCVCVAAKGPAWNKES